MNKFSILGEIIAIDGKRDELADILKTAEQLLLKNNPHCFVYSVNLANEKPDSIFVFETWEDETSHLNSLKDAEVLELIMKGKPLIQSMNRLHTFTSLTQ